MISKTKALLVFHERFEYLSVKVLKFEDAGSKQFTAARARREMEAIRRAIYEMGTPEAELPTLPPWPTHND